MDPANNIGESREQPRTRETEQSRAAPEALAALRRFARARPPVERCELCGAELAGEHAHLLNRSSSQIVCSCDACAILFCAQETAKFVRIPRRILQLQDFAFTDLEWEAMMLPINLAFFLREPDGGTRVLYPSPAGATESAIEMPPWKEIFGAQVKLGGIQPEVEALLVNRLDHSAAYFVVPVDACYRLVGLIRTKWKGLSGGAGVWQAVSDFFEQLEHRATPTSEVTHA
jgi:hypothetical protein